MNVIAAMIEDHPYWTIYVVLSVAAVLFALLFYGGRPRFRPAAPSVGELLARADVNIADFAKTGRLRDRKGRFIKFEDRQAG